MRKILSLAIAAVAFNLSADETLEYNIKFRLGFLSCDAGKSVYTLKDLDGDRCVASNRSWSVGMADTIIEIRDFSSCVMRKRDYAPLSFFHSVSERNYANESTADYSYSNGCVTVRTVKLRRDRERPPKISEVTGSGIVLDQLGVFYYVRRIDDSFYAPGRRRKLQVVSGPRLEEVELRCDRLEKVDASGPYDGREAWHVYFTYTRAGTRSQNMEFWISTDSSRIPYVVRGELPFGKITCELENVL